MNGTNAYMRTLQNIQPSLMFKILSITSGEVWKTLNKGFKLDKKSMDVIYKLCMPKSLMVKSHLLHYESRMINLKPSCSRGSCIIENKHHLRNYSVVLQMIINNTMIKQMEPYYFLLIWFIQDN